MSLVLALSTALLFSCGAYLLMQRRLSRLVIGVALLSHAANLLLLLAGGSRGVAAFVGSTDGEQVADPLPQALALTAIVISFGVTAFVLALAYRSWQLTGDDLVEDDVEDRRIAASYVSDASEEIADARALADAGHDADAGGVAPEEPR